MSIKCQFFFSFTFLGTRVSYFLRLRLNYVDLTPVGSMLAITTVQINGDFNNGSEKLLLCFNKTLSCTSYLNKHLNLNKKVKRFCFLKSTKQTGPNKIQLALARIRITFLSYISLCVICEIQLYIHLRLSMIRK